VAAPAQPHGRPRAGRRGGMDVGVQEDRTAAIAAPEEAEEDEEQQQLLVGAGAVDFVRETLSNNRPQHAIKIVQEAAQLPGDCSPMVSFLEHLGVSVPKTHASILEQARRDLLDLLPNLKVRCIL